MRLNKYCRFVAAFFLSFSLLFPPISFSQEVDLNLPAPYKIKANSKPYNPAVIRAITIDPKDPFLFDFIIDKGDSGLTGQALEAETQKLVKYFLAALTIPENELWVNLSPYEEESMVSPALGVTEMGKDLLVRDYYLKQVTAAMTNPSTPTGKKFWELAYKKAQEIFGTTDVPINTFSKVWIVPDKAMVLEKDGSAFVADSYLKVFLDGDYVAVNQNLDNKQIGTNQLSKEKTRNINDFSVQIIKEIVLPEIEKEVNTGENFAPIRQIYNSAILATWYKTRLKESLLSKLYANQKKIPGIDADDLDAGEKIFEKYTAALKTGAYNMIKQDYDLSTQKIVQRKYFSGGVQLAISPRIQTLTFGAFQATEDKQADWASRRVSDTVARATQAVETNNQGFARATVRLAPAAPLAPVRQDQLNSAGLIAPRSDEFLTRLGVDLTPPDLIDQDQAIVTAARAISTSTDMDFARALDSVGENDKAQLRSFRDTLKQRGQTVFKALAGASRKTLALLSQKSSLFTPKKVDLQTQKREMARDIAVGMQGNDLIRRFTLRRMGSAGFEREAKADISGLNFENFAADNSTAFLEATNVDFMTTETLLQISSQSDYDFFTRLEKQGVSRDDVVKIGEVKKVLATIKPEVRDSPQAFMDQVRNLRQSNVSDFIKQVQSNPVLAQVIIDPNARMESDASDRQLMAAQRFTSMTTRQISDVVERVSVGSDARTIEDTKNKLLESLLAVKKQQIASTKSGETFSLITALQGTYAADRIANDDKFIDAVNQVASSATYLSPSVVRVHVANMDSNELQTRISETLSQSGADITSEEIADIAGALQDVSKQVDVRTDRGRTYRVDSFDPLARVSKIQAALEPRLAARGLDRDMASGRATQLAFLVSTGSNFTALTEPMVTGQLETITALGMENVDSQTIQQALQASGVGAQEAKRIADDALAVRTSSVKPAERGFTSAMVATNRGGSAEILLTMAAHPQSQKIIRERSGGVNTQSPGYVAESDLAKEAGRYYDLFRASPVADQEAFESRLRSVPGQRGRLESRLVTTSEIGIWLASEAAGKPSRELAALKQMPRIQQQLAANARRTTGGKSSSAVAAVASRREKIFDNPDLSPAQLKEFLGMRKANLSGDDQNALARAITKTARYFQNNSTAWETAKGMATSAFVQSVLAAGVLTAPEAALMEQHWTESLEKEVGGIDLSAERMGLQIKRDGDGVPLPVSDQDIENLKIDGLTPVILDMQPATPTNVPFLLNLANNPAQAK